MGKDSKIEERKQYNAPFLRAFKYLADEKMMNQKQFAKVIKAESGYISSLKSGTKRVGADYMARLAAAFIEHFNDEQHLNMEFLIGKSQYMILENVPADEVNENANRSANPDYDVMQKAKTAKLAPTEPTTNTPDISSAINASIAAYVQLTNRLTDDLKAKECEMADRLADKDARIATLESVIADKQKIIEARDARILQLERQIAVMQSSDPSRYPFTVGAAEHSDYPEQRIQK